MALSEAEKAQIGQTIQEEYASWLKEEDVFDVVLRYSGSLGGIENCLHHPDHEQAITLVRDRIAIARGNAIPEDTIRKIVEISLRAYEKGCSEGLYDGEPIGLKKLFAAA